MVGKTENVFAFMGLW